MTTITTGVLGTPALILPLTTVWTPPCDTIVRKEDITKPECGPPEVISVWARGGYYSPGLCPKGYVAGCTRSSMDKVHPFPILEGETAISCVPSGWTCITETPTRVASSIGPDGVVLYEPAFEVRYKEGDFVMVSGSLVPAPTTKSAILSTSAASARPSLGVPETAVPSHTPESPKLHKGAILAIGVGAFIFLCLVAIAALALVRRIRAKASSSGRAATGAASDAPPPYEGLAAETVELRPITRPPDTPSWPLRD